MLIYANLFLVRFLIPFCALLGFLFIIRYVYSSTVSYKHILQSDSVRHFSACLLDVYKMMLWAPLLLCVFWRWSQASQAGLDLLPPPSKCYA